jgi:hypothetical protein
MIPPLSGRPDSTSNFIVIAAVCQWLGIELRGERLDLRLVERVRAAGKALPHGKIIEEKRLCR